MKKTNFFLAIVNLLTMAFLIFRFGLPFVNSKESIFSETESIGIFLSAQANQFAILQVIVSVFGIGLAVVAFWGYIEIMSRAEQKAEKTVQQEVPRLFNEMLDKFGKEELQRMLLDAKMTKPLQKNAEEIFQEGSGRMHKDPLELEGIYE